MNSSFSGILALLVGVGIVIHQVRKKRRNKKLRQQLQRESSATVQRSAPVSRPPLVAYSTGTVSQYMYPYPFGGQTSAAPALQMGVFHGAQGKQPFDSNALSYFDAVGDEAEEACAICLGPLGDEKVAAAPCGHVQHGSCLSSWFSKDLSCPLCRVEFVVLPKGGLGFKARPDAPDSKATSSRPAGGSHVERAEGNESRQAPGSESNMNTATEVGQGLSVSGTPSAAHAAAELAGSSDTPEHRASHHPPNCHCTEAVTAWIPGSQAENTSAPASGPPTRPSHPTALPNPVQEPSGNTVVQPGLIAELPAQIAA